MKTTRACMAGVALSTRAALTATLIATCVATPKPASADETADIKSRGDAAMTAGQPLDALLAYRAAYAKTPDPALLYNMGRAHQALGDIPSAVENLEEFERRAPPELRARVPGLPGLLKELRAKVSQVAISCDVAGASIRIRDKPAGTTPVSSAVRVLAGKATIEITKDGYFPWKREIELPSAGLATVAAHLESKDVAGLLVVSSPVAGAAVAIDGKDNGNVPSEVYLPVGSHRIDLSRMGYKPASTSITLGPGERKTVDLALEREAGILQKWWFWTGVGVVVAGTVTTILILNIEKDGRTGSINPGRVESGLRF